MKRLTAVLAVAVAVAVPASALADQPSSTDQSNAAKECKALRTAMGKVNFANTYGTNENKKNAYGKCVSQKASANKQKADEQDQAVVNAAKTCRAEQKLDPVAFKTKYGTNANKKNAFGKCVSQKAKAQNRS